MTPSGSEPRERAPLPATPALDALLTRVAGRLTGLVWLHGLGTAALAGAGWLAFAFLADWMLHLPAPVRVFHLIVLFALPAWLLARHLVRPLRARPDRAGLAVLVERAHPRSELFVSAVQLRAATAPDGEPELVASVLRDADAAARDLDLAPVLDARAPRRRALYGALCAALVLALLSWNAEAARVFVARMAGGSTPWPQRTHLSLEIPIALAGSVAPGPVSEGELVVRVARGSDVPVVVRAAGEVPEEVVLHFAGGHRSVLGAAGGRAFRTVLRAVQEDLAFHATGGDDGDETPRVRLLVLQPPDVTGIAVVVRPPAYSGLAASTVHDRDVEVLAGSTLAIHVRSAPADVRGRARLLPEDRVIDLVEAPFPAAEGEPVQAGLRFELVAERSLRYRIELVDAEGLSNPDPGLYGITVVEDRAPEVELVSPARGDFDTVAGGLLPLRARAQDDFALARIGYEITAPGTPPGGGELRDMEWRLLTAEERASVEPERASSARASAFARARLEIAALADPAIALEGQQLQLVVRALDNAEPLPREGRSGALRVRIVAPDEFLRRIQDRLARAQSTTSALAELQREKRRRTQEILAVLASDAPGLDGTQQDIASALVGERRVQGDARSLARELTAAAEAVLYARVDERALAALELLDRAQSASLTRGFDPEPWRELAAASRADGLSGSGLAGKLVEIAALSLEISEDHASVAVAELGRAQDASDLPKVQAHVSAAERAQGAVLDRLERLLERLAEWDNFQSVLGLTRDILNGQKGLSERTRQNAQGK